MLHWLVETLRCHADLVLFPSLTIGFFIGLTKTLGLILEKVAAIFIAATVTQPRLANKHTKTLTSQIRLRYDFTDRFAAIGPAFALTQRRSQLIGARSAKACKGDDEVSGPGCDGRRTRCLVCVLQQDALRGGHAW